MELRHLTRDLAEEWADDLLGMTKDSAWDNWGREHLLADRAEKWDRSVVAVRGSRPVGWAVVSRTSEGVHLHHIVVAASERGDGIGTVLVRAIIERAGAATVTLKVHPSNDAAARFYARLGFREGAPTASGYRNFYLLNDEGETA